jgi:hypothetical protein
MLVHMQLVQDLCRSALLLRSDCCRGKESSLCAVQSNISAQSVTSHLCTTTCLK